VTIHINNILDNGTSSIKLGDRLQCYANGNPTPRYEWTIFAELNNITVKSPDFVVNVSMLRNAQLTAECKAMNDFDEKTIRLTRNASGRSKDGLHLFLVRMHVYISFAIHK